MNNLIKSSNLVGALSERAYAEGFSSKTFDLLSVQLFWTNYLVCFGDVERARLIALLATGTLGPADRSVVEQQLSRSEWAEFESLTGIEEWPDLIVDEVAVDLETLKSKLTRKIDREAEETRLLYITNGSGQAMVYQQKYAEAMLVVSGGLYEDTEVPHIISEAAVNNVTVAEQAAIIRDAFLSWQVLSSDIEAKRMAAKKAVSAAETVDDAYAAAVVAWVSA